MATLIGLSVASHLHKPRLLAFLSVCFLYRADLKQLLLVLHEYGTQGRVEFVNMSGQSVIAMAFF